MKERVKHILNYKKPAFWFVIAALAACAVLAVGFLTDSKSNSPGSPQEQPLIYLEDAPKVVSIAQELPYPKAYSYDFISLQTSQQPCGMTVVLRQSGKGSRESFHDCAQIAFDRIHNLGTISFLVQDDQGTQIRMAQHQREGTQLLADLTGEQLIQHFSQGTSGDPHPVTD